MQGCIPLLLPWPGRTPDTVTSFPDAPKISSRCGQHHTTPGAAPPRAHPPVCGTRARTLGIQTAAPASPTGGNGPSLRKRQHRRRAGSTRMPLLALSLRAAAAPAQDSLFLYACSSLPPEDAAKRRQAQHPQAAPQPHLQLEWHLFWLPTNTICLIPWVQLVIFIINPAFPW